MLLFSCSPETGQQPTVRDLGFFQNHVQDLITLNLQTDKKGITIAEPLELVLETTVPEGIEVEFPSFSASLGDFTLKDILLHTPRMTGSGDNVRVIHQATYLLEPYLSGTYTIPAMAVIYRDKNNGLKAVQIITEKIDVAVQSLLSQDRDRAEIKDIKPPLSLPPNRTRQFLLAVLGLLLAALAVSGFFYWKKLAAQKLPAEVRLRPEEIALQELDRLLADDLLARGEIKFFHLRISDILRHYIENRFGLHAPERTSEEFLSELSQAKFSDNALLGSHKALLTDFLTQCDLVKFAKHEPTVFESEKTVVLCREFIEETKEKGERLKAEG